MDTQQLVDERNSWTVITTVIVLTPVSTAFVVASVYSSHIIHRRRLFVEEWLLVVSLILLWLGAAFATKLSLSGGGRHWALLTDTERTNTRFWYWMWSLPAAFFLSVPNIAVASLICRRFNPRRWHVISLWSIAMVGNISFVFDLVLQLFRCKPLRSPWDAGNEQCWDPWITIKYYMFAAVCSAIVDLCLAIYPALGFRQLTWRRQRVAMWIYFGLNIIATGVACYKTSLIPNAASNDFSYAKSGLVVWSMVEGYLLVIAACVPSLLPVYDRLTGRFKNNTRAYQCPSRTRSSSASSKKQGFWSTLKSSFEYYKTGPASSFTRPWSGKSGGRTTFSSTVDMANPRTLEDAANLAYPPAAIWKQTVRVGHHSRIRSQDHGSF